MGSLKDAGIRLEVREELMREVRNGRMSLKTAWKREEGHIFRGERGKLGEADRGGIGGREDSGRAER